MAILTRQRLQALLQKTSGPCISLYIPTHRQHPETEQDPIRFRNAIKEAERLLSDRHPEPEIRALMDPVAAIANLEFWRHQSEGLAVMRSIDMLEEYRLPIAVPELVVVAESFHVRPLIRSLNAGERYFVLALSQAGAELYQGEAGSLSRVEVAGMPADASEFSSGPRPRDISTHATGRGGSSRSTHEAGGGGAGAAGALVPYFRAIDRAVLRAVQKEGAPVILAGVEYFFPIYRSISRLRHLAEAAIPGSPSAASHDALRASAQGLANAIFEAKVERALEKFGRAAGRGKSCEPIEEIVREARRGRVRRLFVASGVHLWGTIDPTSGRVIRTEKQQGSEDDDILDDVAETVYTYGGEVIAVPQVKMPHAAEVVAELR